MNLQRAAFAMIIVILTFYVLYIGQNLLLPLVIAGAIAYLISILAHGISSIRVGDFGVPKALSMLVALGVILLGIGFLINLITVNIQSVVREAPGYQNNIEALIETGYRTFGIEEVPNLQEVIDQIDIGAYLQDFERTVRALVSSTGIIIVYLLFLLLEQRTFADKIRAIIQNRSKQKDAFELIDKMRHDIRSYVAIKVMTSATTGILSFVVLHFVGVDFASFWAVLIFLLNFIPTIGSIIATAFPSVLTLVQFDTLGPFVITITILSAIQFCIGSLVEPKLMGNRLNLSPIVILLSLGLWGSIWGIPGMFLCVPITVILMIVCSYFPDTRPIAVLLSGNGKVGNGLSKEVAAS
jgi:predicted PurR-regulated permease PerM